VKISWRRAGFGYLFLLAASHCIQWRRLDAGVPAGLHVAEIRSRSATIRIAYRDTAPEASGSPVVLIHGSPGSNEVLRRLADLLSLRFRVIVPDLPGFGASTHDLSDYSFRAHAGHVQILLDSLHVPEAHLLGYSMGGGVVLTLADQAPQRVKSLVMLSAIGVQEGELTGSYEWNHVIHGAQLAALWNLRHFFPHFGLVSSPYTVEYARNFYDSDQRPLRGILQRYQGPLLILHGKRDRNVPIAAAREHHRLVLQSELVEYDEDHYMAFQHPERYAAELARFLETVR
jgi:pimeloyl-ACP methyl ester carboxylesterase